MFSSAKTQRELSRMSSDAVALVEEAQPYRGTRTNHPKYDALWVLHELCNTDKHRALHLTSLGFKGASTRGEVPIAGLNFGLMSDAIGTIPLAASACLVPMKMSRFRFTWKSPSPTFFAGRCRSA
jgi:hypothetical protein